MAEYNFWDDRTCEDSDDNYCPILLNNCFSQDCENCTEYAEFAKWLDEHKRGTNDKKGIVL